MAFDCQLPKASVRNQPESFMSPPRSSTWSVAPIGAGVVEWDEKPAGFRRQEALSAARLLSGAVRHARTRST